MSHFINNLRRNAIVRFSLLFVVAGIFFAPLAASAAVTAPQIWPTGYWGTNPYLLSCSGNYPIGGANQGSTQDSYGRPYCSSLTDLLQTAVNIVYFIMTIALFVLAPILFVIGGIMMMLAAGSPEKISKANKTMIAAVVGVVIVLCAYLIVNTIVTTLNITGVAGFGGS